jgi:hypothetical protein
MATTAAIAAVHSLQPSRDVVIARCQRAAPRASNVSSTGSCSTAATTAASVSARTVLQ